VASQHHPEDPTTTRQPADTRAPVTDRTGLAALEIRNFRNLELADLAFDSGLNLITGANASGKTSLLETIYYLGRVRSFRTHVADQPIRYGQKGFRLVGRVLAPSGQTVTVGIERAEGHYNVHLGGQSVHRLSDLAGNFPVQVFSSDTASVLDGGPRQRRHTLDWALFHVEQRYRDTWQRYTRALRQRNAALRAQASGGEITAWNAELLETAQAIDHFRDTYLANLLPYLQSEMTRLLPGTELTLQYLRGWPAAVDLADALADSLPRDFAQGFTRHGPHRADFRLLLDGHPVAAHCSRGQQKSILLGLMLAQVCYQQAVMGTAGAFLLDDLTSELDEAHQSRVLAALRELDAQVFVTAIHADAVNLSAWAPGQVFHVEHGLVQEVV
jgi:DNA replication and repair protein RecF